MLLLQQEAKISSGASDLLVALPSVQDLLLRAKHLIWAATARSVLHGSRTAVAPTRTATVPTSRAAQTKKDSAARRIVVARNHGSTFSTATNS